MLSQPWTKVTITSIDFETTGYVEVQPGQKKISRICEWATVPIRNGVVNQAQAYVEQLDPGIPMNPFAQRKHGLSVQRLRGCQRVADFENEHWMTFGDVVVVHGGATEARHFKEEMAPYFPALILDTLTWARKRHPGEKCGLEYMIPRYGFHPRIKWHPKARALKPHRAYYDAVGLAYLFVEFVNGLRREKGREITIGEIAQICRYEPKGESR